MARMAAHASRVNNATLLIDPEVARIMDDMSGHVGASLRPLT